MQHYGTATRFLDCTYSFYVALFFAIESAIKDINKNKVQFNKNLENFLYKNFICYYYILQCIHEMLNKNFYFLLY